MLGFSVLMLFKKKTQQQQQKTAPCHHDMTTLQLWRPNVKMPNANDRWQVSYNIMKDMKWK